MSDSNEKMANTAAAVVTKAADELRKGIPKFPYEELREKGVFSHAGFKVGDDEFEMSLTIRKKEEEANAD